MSDSSHRDDEIEHFLAQLAVGYERWGLSAEAEDARQAYRRAILLRIKRAVGITTDCGIASKH